MKHYQPRQRLSDGRWDYCCEDMPTGYCCVFFDWRETPALASMDFADDDPKVLAMIATRDKHHTNGHETAEEACECYRQYLLDHRLHVMTTDESRPCEECGELTNQVVEIVNFQWLNLCPEHGSREFAEKFARRVGESWVS